MSGSGAEGFGDHEDDGPHVAQAARLGAKHRLRPAKRRAARLGGSPAALDGASPQAANWAHRILGEGDGGSPFAAEAEGCRGDDFVAAHISAAAAAAEALERAQTRFGFVDNILGEQFSTGFAALGSVAGTTLGTSAWHTASIGGALGNAPGGLKGGVADSHQQLQESRAARRKRASVIGVEGVKLGDGVPPAAYSSVCPLEHACGVNARQLPCGNTRVVQMTFGNPNDLATVKVEAGGKKESDEPVSPGVAIGFPSVEKCGWEQVHDERSIGTFADEEERFHFVTAVEMFGITWVQKLGTDEICMRICFPKEDIPATASEVRKTLNKLMALDHIGVLKLVEVFEDAKEVHLLYEKQGGPGYLAMRIFARRELLSVSESAKLCQQLASAAAAFHRSGAHHFDWSIWNIISSSYSGIFPMKLFGVGLIGLLHPGGPAAARSKAAWIQRGAFYYMSPELCRIHSEADVHHDVSHGLHKLDQKLKGPCDIWAIGAIVYTALCGRSPVGGADEAEVMENAAKVPASFQYGFEALDSAGKQLLENLLSQAPCSRPKAEKVMMNPWVVRSCQAMEDRSAVHKIFANLQHFSQQSPVMRAVGQVLLQSMRDEKMRFLMDHFHILDIKGDGELEFHEFSASFGDTAADVRAIFDVLDLNGSGSMSLKEFVLANIFADDVLTERMLLRSFDFLDMDGTGEISPIELFEALKKFDSKLTPQEVAEFMGNADTDWDADVDFAEFKSFFPNIISNSYIIEQRVFYAVKLQDAILETFEQFDRGCSEWRRHADEIKKDSHSVAKKARKDDNCEKAHEWCKDMMAVLRQATMHIRNTPRPYLAGAYVKDEKFAQELSAKTKQALLEAGGGSRTAKAKQILSGGPSALDNLFRASGEAWREETGRLFKIGKGASTTTNQLRRRQDSITVLDELSKFMGKVSEFVDEHVDEQVSFLQAADVEEGMPKLSFGRKGLPIVGAQDEKLMAELAQYMNDRQHAVEQDALDKEEQEKRRELVGKTEFGGEQRSFAWLERQRRKAEKKGHAPGPETQLREGLALARRGLDETFQTFQSLASPTATAGAQTLANFQTFLSPGPGDVAAMPSPQVGKGASEE